MGRSKRVTKQSEAGPRVSKNAEVARAVPDAKVSPAAAAPVDGSGIEGVDLILCVSVPWRSDRRTHMAETARRHGLKIEFVEATTSVRGVRGPPPECCVYAKLRSLQRCCALALERSAQCALILEDDCWLREGFAEELRRIACVWDRARFPSLMLGPLPMSHEAGARAPFSTQRCKFFLNDRRTMFGTVATLMCRAALEEAARANPTPQPGLRFECLFLQNDRTCYVCPPLAVENMLTDSSIDIAAQASRAAHYRALCATHAYF